MDKPLPSGWPRISGAVFYDDPARAIDWLCAAFGFEVRLKVEGPGGRIEHSELTIGEGLIMVGSAGGRSDRPGGWVAGLGASAARAIAQQQGGSAVFLAGERRGTTIRLNFLPAA